MNEKPIASMDALKILIALSVTFALPFLASAPADTGCIGDCSGDSAPPPPCQDDPSQTCPLPSDPMCIDGGDNDSDQSVDGKDSNDLGCVKPYNYDWVEGNIWDSDLTSIITDGSTPSASNSESIFFEGILHSGNDDTPITDTDTVNSGQITEYYIQDRGTEGKRNWGIGKKTQAAISSFPDGTVFENGRAVDPPNPDGSKSCGDGEEGNEGYTPPSPFGDEPGDEPSSSDVARNNCVQDYGRIHQKLSIRTPYKQDSLQCRDDDVSCNDADCSGSACGGVSCTDGQCWVDTDYSSDEDNTYYWLEGDTIQREDCNYNDYPEDSVNGCSAGDSSTCCATDQYGNCISYGDECSASGDSAGDERQWENSEQVNCNTYNVVDGGGDEESRSTDSIADNDPAGTYTEFTSYGDNTEDEAWCGYEYTTTVDADGPRGYGDGFVVIHDGQIMATMSPDGSERVGQRVHVDGSLDSTSYLSRVDTSCPGDKTTCLKYADFYTEHGSEDPTSGTAAWTDADGAVRVDTQSFSPAEGYSVCKMINRINEQNGKYNNDELIDCDYERGNQGSQDVSPLPEACGDEPQEHLIVTEGNEVIEDNTQEYLKHAQKCVDWDEDNGKFGEGLDSAACVYNGRVYSEGSVINVASPGGSTYFDGTTQYERGDNSPDREVCLDVDETGTDLTNPQSSDSGQYLPWDNTGNTVSGQDFGGEWYDLDNEMANEYLNDEGEDLINNGDPGDSKDVAYYWGENPNPEDSEYNEGGDSDGLALEDDCGPYLNCDDTGDSTGGDIVDSSGDPVDDGLFYSFFAKRVQDGANPDGTTIRRDEDYNATGDDQSSGHPTRFTGYMNKLKSLSDQLQQDDNYYENPADYTWSNSDGSEDDADQWALSRYLSWSISNRGVPYPPGPLGAADSEIGYAVGSDTYTLYTGESGHDNNPAGGTYYQYDYTGRVRTDVRDYGVSKTDKVFANSFAAVADQTFTDEKGDTVMEGEGVWIDPDNIRSLDSQLKGDWRDKVVFNIDITGPDSGIGFNVDDNADLGRNQGGMAVYGDIYFQGENDEEDNDGDGSVDEGISNANTVGETVDRLKPPMCGDDESEYLLEEIGESVNPAQGDGRYACAQTRSVCVQRSSTPRIIQEGDYRNTDEPMESQGRLKRDSEICVERQYDFLGQDKNVAKWWDQDWGWIQDGDGDRINTCRENGLYGQSGVRWFGKDYVRAHPNAVTGGIDDDWNEHIKRQPYTANESMPDASTWNSDQSPVPTGSTPNTSIATIGFCGGDDQSEYLVTQRCNSNLCDTKRSVQGVARNPDSCMFDGDEAKYYADSNSKSYDVSERGLYQPGDTVTLDPGNDGQELRTLTCFDNTWYRDFPIVFQEESVNVSLGAEERVPFQVINVRDSPRTFDVSLEPGSEIYTYSSFDEKEGDSFNTTIPAESSKQFRVVIAGGDLTIDNSELFVQADSINTEMYGEDSVFVDVVNSTAANGTVLRQEPQSVPGAGPLQLLVLMAMASAVFFIQS